MQKENPKREKSAIKSNKRIFRSQKLQCCVHLYAFTALQPNEPK